MCGDFSRIFVPCGFGTWQASTALIAGFTAKEAVVSTLGVLTNDISLLFTGASAFSFMTFTLLYTPCIAAVTTLKKETKSILITVGVVVMQCVVAWVFATAIYQIIVACGG